MSLLQNLQNYHKQLIKTSDGTFTIKENNRYIHSQRSPLKEAQRLIQPCYNLSPDHSIIILWGVGLGYHTEILVDMGFKIIAIETRPKVATIFKNTFPIDKLHGFIESNPSQLFDILVNIPAHYSQNIIEISMQGIEIPQDFFDYTKKAKLALQSTHRIHKFLMESWYCNILQNFSIFQENYIGYTHDFIFQDQELIICSAGPSLRESLPYLKLYQKNFTIMAVDTALQSVLHYDIIPDYVHAVDAKIHNIGDFAGISDEIFNQIILIADITLSHQIVRYPWKKVIFTTTVQAINTAQGLQFQNLHLMNYFKECGITLLEIQTGGSVANSAFHIGIKFHAKRILLVGQDLAYSNNRGHATGSPYDLSYRSTTSRLSPLDTIHIHKLTFDYPILSSKKTTTYSDPLLIQFRQWFETSLLDNPHLYKSAINSSEAGAHFNHWQYIPLSIYKITTSKKLCNIKISSYSKEQLASIYRYLDNMDISMNNSNEIIKEYFYKEYYSPYTATKLVRKIRRLQKIIQKAIKNTT